MRNIHYKIKSFRLSEELYQDLRQDKPVNMSWNQFISQLLKEWKKHRQMKHKKKVSKVQI